jgi:hypothetical protein
MLAVRYVTLPDGVAPPATTPVTLLATQTNLLGEPYQIFELNDPRPLAWLVYDARPAGSHGEAMALLADPSINLRETAITNGAIPLTLPGARPEQSMIVEAVIPRPDRIDVRAETSSPALLLVAAPNYPGWKATINGQPVEIVEVDGGLIGVPIAESGTLDIRLEFAPTLQIIAVSISLIVLALATGIAVWEWRRTRSIPG